MSPIFLTVLHRYSTDIPLILTNAVLTERLVDASTDSLLTHKLTAYKSMVGQVATDSWLHVNQLLTGYQLTVDRCVC